MQAVDTIHLAAWVSAHARPLVEQPGALPCRHLFAYWSATRCRLDRWSRAIRRITAEPPPPRSTMIGWPRVCGLVEEVLLTDVLNRVWACLLVAHDQRHSQEQAEPIADSALAGHEEARVRALKLLMHLPGVELSEARRLNRLRQQTERWTDLLIGNLVRHFDVARLAIQPARARDFAADLAHDVDQHNLPRSWRLLMSSLRSGFRSARLALSPNGDLNQRVAACVLSCFAHDAESCGELERCLWLNRLENTADEAQALVDHFWRP